jgi:hypothetical protein
VIFDFPHFSVQHKIESLDQAITAPYKSLPLAEITICAYTLVTNEWTRNQIKQRSHHILIEPHRLFVVWTHKKQSSIQLASSGLSHGISLFPFYISVILR